jgi:glucose/arabinose dehydrogenase/mono/diheme cytochrome c family protein
MITHSDAGHDLGHLSFSKSLRRALPVLLALAASTTPARGAAPAAARWADWIEPDFPFVSSVVDARKSGPQPAPDNLTPRGLVLNLGAGNWACFDTELLRVSAVWRGKGVTLKSGSQISYQEAGQKSADGQADLATPDGAVWLDNGLYPGWQHGETPRLSDPRSPAPSPEEIGRGPLPAEAGRFRAVRLSAAGVVLEYSVGNVAIEESLRATTHDDKNALQRTLRIAKSESPLLLIVGRKVSGDAAPRVRVSATDGAAATLLEHAAAWVVRIPAHSQPLTLRVDVAQDGAPWDTAPVAMPARIERPAPARWPQTVTTRGKLSASGEAYVVDAIPLPATNPWRRNVRLADIQFTSSGRGYGVTFDGDVWAIDGLDGELESVTWRRFASGLHEPLSLAVRRDEIFVFDRNGIWRLVDRDGNGEADVHELFSNAFAQTADHREFATGMKLAPDGSFVIVKGGQQDTTFGKHNGAVLRVSADGKSSEVLGWGFRQALIGIHPKTGLVTASDQEGQYIPTTPLQIVEKNQYYGFATRMRPREQHPAAITDPVTWIPRQVNPSAASQVWLVGAKMGPLNDTMLHLGYNRPEVFSVLWNGRGRGPQAAVVSLTQDLRFAPLSAGVNPRDGQVYVAGFRVFATTAQEVSGLARLRHTGRPYLLPREVVPMQQGVLLRFDVELDERSLRPGAFAVERWNYRRTYKYGSPHYRLDGSLGQERMLPGSVHLSRDRKSVFIALADMRAGVMQMHLNWSLRAHSGAAMNHSASFTPQELLAFQPELEGFAPAKIDVTPVSAAIATTDAAPRPSPQEGRRLYTFLGCMACHTIDDSTSKGLGPNWKGLFGSERLLADGAKVVADESYLRESIVAPGAKLVKGYENGMPMYAGVITDNQIESLVQFIKSLR